MKSELLDIALILPNEGQIEGVPANPRKISEDKMEALKRSIQNLPDMLSMRELIVYPMNDKSKSVLDLFGGSGSSLIACEQLKRKCYMMELSPHCCDVIIARWEKLTGKKAELING